MKIIRLLSDKIVTALILILVLGTALFAAQAELELSTKVDPVNELKITKDFIPTLQTWGNTTVTAELEDLDTTPVTGLHLNLMTNLRKSITINMTAPHLASEQSSWKIPYTLILGPEESFTSDDGTSEHTFVEYLATAIDGRTILTTSFSLQLDSTAYQNALAGTYEAVLTFEVIAD